jgi:hypothetical protein
MYDTGQRLCTIKSQRLRILHIKSLSYTQFKLLNITKYKSTFPPSQKQKKQKQKNQHFQPFI